MEFIADSIAFIIKFPFIIIGWIIIGMIAGDVARRLTNSADRSGFSDFLLGIFGAFVGGFVAGLFGIGGPDGGIAAVLFNLVIATVGAALVVIAWRTVTGGDKRALD